MKLSQYFDLSEFEYSDTAKQHGITNTVPRELIPDIVRLHDNVLLPLRKALGAPVTITSGYRGEKLNKLIGGAVNSQHCKGQAADISVKGQSNLAVFNFIRQRYNFDQLILENVNGAQWVHVSYNINGNRKQCLSYDGKSYKSI